MRATVAAIVVIGTLAAAPSAYAGFGLGGTELAGDQPSAVVTGDFDNDGADDQAIANKGSHDVTILRSDGGGSFISSSQGLSAGIAPTGLAVGDLDNNGRLDLVTANEGSDSVSILLGDGAGGFTDVNTEAVGTDPAAVAIADLDDNGKADLAVANRGSGDVSILLGDGGGGFDASPLGPEALDPGAAPSGLVTADLNGDAEPDFAVADAGGDVVSLFLGMASGDFFKAGDFAVGTDPAGLAAGDLDRDGLDDIAVANEGSDDLTILTDDGFGGFGATASSPVALDDGAEPAALVAEDFDLDGRPDLAVANAGHGRRHAARRRRCGRLRRRPGEPVRGRHGAKRDRGRRLRSRSAARPRGGELGLRQRNRAPERPRLGAQYPLPSGRGQPRGSGGRAGGHRVRRLQRRR